MKIVAFNGSPRRNGNTQHLLQRLLDTAAANGAETELVHIGGKPLQGCTACMGCMKNKDQRCVITGDRLNEYLAKMIAADAIVIGSPSYFADMSAETKALVDRAGFVSVANGRLFKRKIGAAVVAERRGGAINVYDSINHMFQMSQMILPGSTYWNFGVGMDEGDVDQDQEAMANMEDLGETICWLLQRLTDPGQPQV